MIVSNSFQRNALDYSEENLGLVFWSDKWLDSLSNHVIDLLWMMHAKMKVSSFK